MACGRLVADFVMNRAWADSLIPGIPSIQGLSVDSGTLYFAGILVAASLGSAVIVVLVLSWKRKSGRGRYRK